MGSIVRIIVVLQFGLLVVKAANLIHHGFSNEEVLEELGSMRGELTSLHSQVNQQAEMNHNLRSTVNAQDRRIKNMKQILTANPSQQNQQTDFGCFSRYINLWCFDGGVINVTDAYYGKYNLSCELECCMPDQVDDCRVSVIDNNPSDWLSLKLSCDNQTSCSYEYLGSAIDECEEDYLADYMQIYYGCGPETLDYDPIGFTAFAVTNRYYYYNEPVEFPGIISNIGDSYDASNSSFTCPYRGVYMFSLTAKTDSYDYIYLEILRDGAFIAEAWGDGQNSASYATAAAVVVIECEAGQVVWVSSGDNTARVHGSPDRQTLFSGYMLHRYE